MDRDFLIDLFSEFGPVSVRRMFSGYGVSADGTNFALVLRGAVYFRADAETIARFEDEGCKPFQYETRAKRVTVNSYWQLPDRLYDDPAELAQWARAALAAAERAAAAKRTRVKRAKPADSGAKPSAPKPLKLKSSKAKSSKAKSSKARSPKARKPIKKAAPQRASKR